MDLSLLRRVKKVFPNLVFTLHQFPNFSRVATNHSEYDDDYDVEEGEVLVEVVSQVPIGVENTIDHQTQLTYET